jgi:hypothetical protein
MPYDEAWLRERGYRLVGDTAVRVPAHATRLWAPRGCDEPPEATLLAQVRRCARAHGYCVYHTRDSRGSDCGFPDLCLVRPGRLIFAELKSAQGKLTREQHLWLDMLRRSVPGVSAHVWRPADWSTIQEVLRQP